MTDNSLWMTMRKSKLLSRILVFEQDNGKNMLFNCVNGKCQISLIKDNIDDWKN